MRIPIRYEATDYDVASWIGSNSCTDIFCLHGFTGHYLDFEILAEQDSELLYNWHSIECPGHGDSSLTNEDLYHDGFFRRIHGLIHEISDSKQKPKILLGYSMGGRYALRCVLAYPNAFDALILIGTNSGIEDSRDRELRVERDKAWIDKLQKEGLPRFLEDWMDQPLLRSQETIDSFYLERMISRKKNLRVDNLIYSLQYFGAGSIEPVTKSLDTIKMPTLLLCGENDSLYRGKMEPLRQNIKNSRFMTVKKSGHSCHMENPLACYGLISEFIESLK